MRIAGGVKRVVALAATVALLSLAAPARPAAAGEGDEALSEADREVVKPIRTLIQAIRYSKDDIAASFLAYDEMSKLLLGDAWEKLSEAERKEFADGLAFLLRKISFPKVREKFEHLDAILYEAPRREAPERARVRSTVTVYHELKKVELVLDYVMIRHGGKWVLLDVVVDEGESTMDGIREDQVKPLLDEGGVALVLKTLREKVEETRKKG